MFIQLLPYTAVIGRKRDPAVKRSKVNLRPSFEQTL